MKYHLENLSRYLIYIYYLIIGSKNNLRILTQWGKLNPNENKLFLVGKEHISQFYFKSFKVLNNKWGEWKLKNDEKYIQSLFENNNIIGWNYQTPNKNRGVIGYPEILIGKSPFGGESNSEYLPKKINQINTLNATYDISMYIEPKKYNLVFDLWVTKQGKNQADDISHEIMIWEDRNVATPDGKFIKEVNTTSGTYKMYNTWMDRSKENLGTPGWYFTAFVRKDRRRSGTVNFKEFIHEMRIQGILDENHFISTIEFGNEIYNACGYTIVNDYEVNMK